MNILEKLEKQILSIPVWDASRARENKADLEDIRKKLFNSTIIDVDYDLPSYQENLNLCSKFNKARGKLIKCVYDDRMAAGLLRDSDWSKFFHSIPTKIHSNQAKDLFRKIPQEIISDFHGVFRDIFYPFYQKSDGHFGKVVDSFLGRALSCIDVLCLFSSELLLINLLDSINCQRTSFGGYFTAEDLLKLFRYSLDEPIDIIRLEFLKTHVGTEKNKQILEKNLYLCQFIDLKRRLDELKIFEK